MTKGILDVDNVKTTEMAFTVHNGTDTSHIVPTGDHGDVASIELDEIFDLASVNVELDGVVGLDQGIGVTDGATVMGHHIRDTLGTKLNLLDLAELVL